MSDDWKVPGLSDEEIRAIAKRTKIWFKVSDRRPVNILRCLESGSVHSQFGRKRLNFVVVDDHLMGSADAKTEYAPGNVTIAVKRSVCEHAKLGMGRDRMTLAHELAHAVLHQDNPKFRHYGATGTTTLSRVSAYQSAEHQAKVFAAAFLIHDEQAAQMQNAEEISAEFGVSLEAARICFARLRQMAERHSSALRVRKSADDAIRKLKQHAKPIRDQTKRYLEAKCARCSEQTLIPLGIKIRCESCGFIRRPTPRWRRAVVQGPYASWRLANK